METYISILRGINVGGKNVIKMDALKQICASLNFKNVQTYIQSGNIIFQAKINDTSKISNLISTTIKRVFELQVPVITVTVKELQAIITLNPFVKNKVIDTAFLHITFLANQPLEENIPSLKNVVLKQDKFEIINKAIYLYCPDSYSNSKLTNNFFETKLAITATTRNWKTANELLNKAINSNI